MAQSPGALLEQQRNISRVFNRQSSRDFSSHSTMDILGDRSANESQAIQAAKAGQEISPVRIGRLRWLVGKSPVASSRRTPE
jgi:hypothetical protein